MPCHPISSRPNAAIPATRHKAPVNPAMSRRRRVANQIIDTAIPAPRNAARTALPNVTLAASEIWSAIAQTGYSPKATRVAATVTAIPIRAPARMMFVVLFAPPSSVIALPTIPILPPALSASALIMASAHPGLYKCEPHPAYRYRAYRPLPDACPKSTTSSAERPGISASGALRQTSPSIPPSVAPAVVDPGPYPWPGRAVGGTNGAVEAGGFGAMVGARVCAAVGWSGPGARPTGPVGDGATGAVVAAGGATGTICPDPGRGATVAAGDGTVGEVAVVAVVAAGGAGSGPGCTAAATPPPTPAAAAARTSPAAKRRIMPAPQTASAARPCA